MTILEAMNGSWVLSLSGIVVWKILYRFGDEDLVI